uniref:Uncharacterized protein n=1 Tax=Arundo donax TaxID=35708 RepID=A0A0A9C987_ARUDO
MVTLYMTLSEKLADRECRPRRRKHPHAEINFDKPIDISVAVKNTTCCSQNCMYVQ